MKKSNLLRFLKSTALTQSLFVITSTSLAWSEPLQLDPINGEHPVIGVVGDSLSDEYDPYPYGWAEKNWTVLLEDTGYGELGDFQTFRLDSRLYGYEYNWARAGATTSNLLNEGQLIGLGLQIIEGKIEVAVMLIGANDFREAYSSIYNSNWSETQISDFMQELKDNLKEIVEGLRIANPPILIVSTIPDLGDTPNYRYGDFKNAEKRALVTQYIQEANQYIIELANANQAAVVDAYTWFKLMVAQEEARIMGYRIHSNSGGYEANHMFTIDNFHPGTLTQCKMANMILTAIENERVRIINERIESTNATQQEGASSPDLTPVDPVTARNREIPNSVIFPMLEIDPSADIFFPESQFTDPSHNVILSPWFGVLATKDYPWINHQEHGWLYCDGYGGSVWVRMWDSNLGWLHTKPEAYPIFIQVSNGHAIRYELGSKEPRRFFDLETQSWIEIPYGAAIIAEE